MTGPAAGCPTCSGLTRQTVGMVCPTCGTDYRPADADAIIRNPDATVTGRLTAETITSAVLVRRTCGAAAPVVVNGGHFAGCVLDAGHPDDQLHEFTVQWA